MRWPGVFRFTHGSTDGTAFIDSRNRSSAHGYAVAERANVAYLNFYTDSHPTPDTRGDRDADGRPDTHRDGVSDGIVHRYADRHRHPTHADCHQQSHCDLDGHCYRYCHRYPGPLCRLDDR